MAFNNQGRPQRPVDPRIIQQAAQLRGMQMQARLPGVMPGMVPGAGILGRLPMQSMIPQMMPTMMSNPMTNPGLAPLIQSMRGLPQYAAAAAAAAQAAQMQQNLQMIAAASAQMLQNQRMPQNSGGIVQGQGAIHPGMPVSVTIQRPNMMPGTCVQSALNSGTTPGQITPHMSAMQGQTMQSLQQATHTTQALPNVILSGPMPVTNSMNQSSNQFPGSIDQRLEDNQSCSSISSQDRRHRDRCDSRSRESRISRAGKDHGRSDREEQDRESRRSSRSYDRSVRSRSRRRSRDRDAPPLRRPRNNKESGDDRRGSSRLRDPVDVRERSVTSRASVTRRARDRSRSREARRPRERSRTREPRSRGESVQAESVRRESMRGESVRGELVRAESVRREPVRAESVRREPVRAESVRREPLRGELVRAESVRRENHDSRRAREISVNKKPSADVEKIADETSGAEEKPKVDDTNLDDDDADTNIGEEIWKEMHFGESGDEEDLDLNEESQDVLSKEKAYLELKARKKQEELDDQMRGSPVPQWIRSSPADLYFKRDRTTQNIASTKRMTDLTDKFEKDLVTLAQQVRDTKPKYEPLPRPNPIFTHKHHCTGSHDDGSSDSSSEDSDGEIEITWMDELNRKQEHPERLHKELWFNEKDEMNDGPLCRCSLKARKSGIRHNIYPGESGFPICDKFSNNCDKLYHYRITMSPHTNFLTKNPTIIEHDNHEYIFEGFSLFSHYKLENVPVCKVIRFNIEYTIHWFEDEMPDNFDVKSLDLFMEYLFHEILELDDLDWKPLDSDQCCRFHIMPRFLRGLPDNGKEMLSMNDVLLYLLRSFKPLICKEDLEILKKLANHNWQDMVDGLRGMIVTCPGMRPSSIRVDQLDRDQMKEDGSVYPIIIHFGIRPAQLSYAGDPNYQRLWKQYVKFKHLLANKPKVTVEDKQKLVLKEEQLQEMRTKSNMKREVTVELSAEGFYKTGIRSDVCQHAMLLPVLISHLRFHRCLDVLEKRISYTFKERMLLQLALTHPSYRVNFGTNPDHARNSLSNCGIRQPEYGDSRIHHLNTRKRGINILINIMSRLGRKEETPSEINHYERLEFLGDAVVEFLSSIHLFFMFPSLEEGGLATYRAAIVQNQHLAVLAKKLKLQDFMLYAHGPDLCHESDLRHAMANCLEALMGALYLDGGIELADRVYGEVLFDDDPKLLSTWMNLPLHPLQEDEPNGDRHWLSSSPALQKLVTFEEDTGLMFNHIRLLARSFTMRNVGYNNLTLGHNQRLEFLGDTVLQLVASAYLFKHFPEHHEGHLSLLRSSLVNNRTQAVVCDDLGMTDYIIHAENRTLDQGGMKHKEKADLLEALIGALYVDKDLETCEVFCHVCFFPRLKMFIMNQDWNDPKSQLQQCCLTLRELDGGEPDIPTYKVIASTGPTNTRRYTVAVYFRGERLATGTGNSIQHAEMNAATNALKEKSDLFPQLQHQKRFIQKKYRKRKWKDKLPNFDKNRAEIKEKDKEDRDGRSAKDDKRQRSRTDRGQKRTTDSRNGQTRERERVIVRDRDRRSVPRRSDGKGLRGRDSVPPRERRESTKVSRKRNLSERRRDDHNQRSPGNSRNRERETRRRERRDSTKRSASRSTSGADLPSKKQQEPRKSDEKESKANNHNCEKDINCDIKNKDSATKEKSDVASVVEKNVNGAENSKDLNNHSQN